VVYQGKPPVNHDIFYQYVFSPVDLCEKSGKPPVNHDIFYQGIFMHHHFPHEKNQIRTTYTFLTTTQ